MNSLRILAIIVPLTNCGKPCGRASSPRNREKRRKSAKNKLVDSLVDAHEFPVPTVFVDQQIRNRLEQSLRSLAAEGVDPESLKLDWEKIKQTQQDRARREVKGISASGRGISARIHLCF